MEIRPVQASDLGKVSQLENISFSDPYPPYFLSQLAENNPDTFLVAVTQEKLLGYAVADEWADHDHLISIAVHPEQRRRGIAQQLFSVLESRLPKGHTMKLEVRRGNNSAIEFYKKNGFREAGVQERYYLDGEDALLMEKQP